MEWEFWEYNQKVKLFLELVLIKLSRLESEPFKGDSKTLVCVGGGYHVCKVSTIPPTYQNKVRNVLTAKI